MIPSQQSTSRQVWDIFVRLFHWSLVILVLLLWVSGEFGGLDISIPAGIFGKDAIYLDNMDIHALLGQGVLVLVLFRVFWGLWGSSTARFSSFVRGPRMVVAELSALARGQIPEHQGHNPLGAVMIIALLLSLGLQAITGLFSSDDFFFEGPLAQWVSAEFSEKVTGFHKQIFTLIEILVISHIAAVFYYLLRGQNLVRAMITGRKSMPAQQTIVHAPWWRALLSLLLAISILCLVVNF